MLTGAVEVMVVDVQCIMQALSPLAKRFHTKLVTTSPKARIPGAEHVAVRRSDGARHRQGARAHGDRQLPEPRPGAHSRLPRTAGGRLLARVPELHAGRLPPRLLPAAERRHHRRPRARPGRHRRLQQRPRHPGPRHRRAHQELHRARRDGRGDRLRRDGRRQGRLPLARDPRRGRPGPARGHGGDRHSAGAPPGLLRRQLADPHGAHPGRHRGRSRRGHRRPAGRRAVPRVDVREGGRHRHLLRRLRRPRDLRRGQPGARLQRGHAPDDHRLGGARRRRASSSSPTGRRCWPARSS